MKAKTPLLMTWWANLKIFSLATASLGLSAWTTLAQVALHRMTPVSGPPGTTVTLVGENFGTVSQAQLNGVAATVTRMTSTEVQFTVPAGARSGFVAVQMDGAWLMNPVPFTITRPIQGRFNPPGG